MTTHQASQSPCPVFSENFCPPGLLPYSLLSPQNCNHKLDLPLPTMTLSIFRFVFNGGKHPRPQRSKRIPAHRSYLPQHGCFWAAATDIHRLLEPFVCLFPGSFFQEMLAEHRKPAW